MAGIGKYLFYLYYPTTIFLSLSLFPLSLSSISLSLIACLSFSHSLSKISNCLSLFLFDSLEFTSHPPFISPLFLAYLLLSPSTSLPLLSLYLSPFHFSVHLTL